MLTVKSNLVVIMPLFVFFHFFSPIKNTAIYCTLADKSPVSLPAFIFYHNLRGKQKTDLSKYAKIPVLVKLTAGAGVKWSLS